VLKRPSSRRKSGNEGITLNLVPVLDAMVTLIGFLLFTMSFLQIVDIESPFPQASKKDVEQKLKEKPVQLTVTLNPTDAEIWSPFDRIEARKIPNGPDGLADIKSIHEALIEVKKQYPKENQIVIVPYAGANYELLIGVMDAMRVLDPLDPKIYIRNETTGVDEAAKALFPDVVFGNLLGDV
jgi:biopolymer transport protein ExbD